MPDEELLEMRLCDLGLRLEGSVVDRRVRRLHAELEARGLRFRPHCWLAEEWFSPDNVPGIAIPFYLAHPRLIKLERKMMLDVEGGTESWCLRLLRHEAGHAIDTAYGLHRRRRWRELFGRFSQPYPDYYMPRPYSTRYVLHLDFWYAQSHPAEDFAETFAVWLKPRSRWRVQYAGWSAIDKLRYVDELMKDVRDKKPTLRSRRHVEPLRQCRKSLRQHYDEKRHRYELGVPDVYDPELLRLFSNGATDGTYPSAATFMRRIRPELRRVVARWTRQSQYMIDQVLGEIITRCTELDLRVTAPAEEAKQDAMVMVAVQTINFLNSGRHRVAL